MNPPAVFTYSLAAFGEGTGRIHIDDANCTGQERRLLDCPFDFHTADCAHAEDAAIKCVAGSKLSTMTCISDNVNHT